MSSASAGGSASTDSFSTASSGGSASNGGSTTDGGSASNGASTSTSGGSSETGDGGGSTGGASGCLPTSVQDDFAEPELDETRWAIDAATGVTIEVVDGRLTFTPIENFDNTRNAAVRTAGTFDLTGCSTWVEVPRVLPDGVSGETFWTLTIDGQNNATVRVVGANMLFHVVIDGEASEAVVPYDSDAHRWWRMRDEAGVMHLETSPTGSDWTEQLQESHPWDLSAVRIGLVMHTGPTMGTFEGPEFDNVNVLP